MKYFKTYAVLFLVTVLPSCTSSDTDETEPKTFTTEFSTTSLDFGNVNTSNTLEKNFSITNTGSETIIISNITTPNAYSIVPTNTSISSGDEQNFTIHFTPLSDISYNGIISITSNSNSSASTINVIGTGVISAKTYTNTIAPIIAQSCATTACHDTNNPAAQLSMTSFTEVKNGFIVDDSWGEIQSGSMPKPGVPSLTQDDKDNLQLWINSGFPSGELATTSYINHIAPIINQSCATTACHDGSRFPNLTSYAKVKTAFEATGNSSAIFRIEAGTMPKDSDDLPLAQIDLIKAWIETGFIQQ